MLIVPRKRPMFGAILSVLGAAMIVGSSPSYAHEEHRRQRAAALKAEQMRQQAALRPESAASRSDGLAPPHAATGQMMNMPKVDRSEMPASERLLDWIGRLHPVIVHFPIAFFPAALFTAIVGRRRPAYSQPVQFLVVAGGIIAPIAALLGWIDGGFNLASDDWLLGFHRWFGTAVGVGALALAVYAIRKPEQDRGLWMICGLGVMTAAIIIQGWFGGALTHGVDHMNW